MIGAFWGAIVRSVYDGGLRDPTRDEDTVRADISEPPDDRWLRAFDRVKRRTEWAEAASVQFVGTGDAGSWLGRVTGYIQWTVPAGGDSLFSRVAALIEEANREAREDAERE